MPVDASEVTFVASGTPIAVMMAVLSAGAVVIAVLLVQLTAAAWSHGMLATALPIILLMAAVLAPFFYVDTSGWRALRDPARLTVDHQGISETRFGSTRSFAWRDMGEANLQSVSMGRATLHFIAFAGSDAKLRSDIYPQDQDAIMAVIADARAGRPLTMPPPSGVPAWGLPLAVVIGLSMLALLHFWIGD